MRDKQEILIEYSKLISELPEHRRLMLAPERLFLEVQIDTRDILRWLHTEIKDSKIF